MTGKERMMRTRQGILDILVDGQERTRMEVFELMFPADVREIRPGSWNSLKRAMSWLCGNSSVEWRFCREKETILFKICAPEPPTG